jgi:hypothetical protein
MPPQALDDDTLLRLFESCELPNTQFKHAEHIRVAWTLLSRHPLLDALQRFRSDLKAYAAHNRVPGLYNETVTCFYLLLIRERMDSMTHGSDWQAFGEANPDIFAYPKVFLEAYYPAGLAFTEQAKQVFLLPQALVNPSRAA